MRTEAEEENKITTKDITIATTAIDRLGRGMEITPADGRTDGRPMRTDGRTKLTDGRTRRTDGRTELRRLTDGEKWTDG